jgi:hypothetical protein
VYVSVSTGGLDPILSVQISYKAEEPEIVLLVNVSTNKMVAKRRFTVTMVPI